MSIHSQQTEWERITNGDIPLFLYPEDWVKSIKAQHFAAFPTEAKTPWEDLTERSKFKPMMFLRADSFQPMPAEVFRNLKTPEKFGDWILHVNVIPKAHKLRNFILKGKSHRRHLGWVQFDKDVNSPCLYNRADGQAIMSLTPMEIMSLQPLVDAAKGDVVITGLGLGYLLYKVMQKPEVTSVRLIEIDPRLAGVMMRRLLPVIDEKRIKLIIGDCREKLPKMKGDVLLLDHFPRYGYNWELVTPQITSGFKEFVVWG